MLPNLLCGVGRHVLRNIILSIALCAVIMQGVNKTCGITDFTPAATLRAACCVLRI